MVAYEILCGDRMVGVFFPDYSLAVLYPPNSNGFTDVGSLKTLEKRHRDKVNDGYCYPWKLGAEAPSGFAV